MWRNPSACRRTGLTTAGFLCDLPKLEQRCDVSRREHEVKSRTGTQKYARLCAFRYDNIRLSGRVEMTKEYVEKREGAYRISGTRVSLESVVYAFLRGASPESITQSFPALTLEEVYGAIAFYLAHQTEIDAYLREGEGEFEALRQQARQANPLLYQKIEEARRQQPATRK